VQHASSNGAAPAPSGGPGGSGAMVVGVFAEWSIGHEPILNGQEKPFFDESISTLLDSCSSIQSLNRQGREEHPYQPFRAIHGTAVKTNLSTAKSQGLFFFFCVLAQIEQFGKAPSCDS
jgi:hypothetical protein